MSYVDILLVFSLSDLDDDDTASEPRIYDSRCPMVLEPLGNNLFRVVEPTSLTAFGPLGPRFCLGQVIEAEPLTDGVWTFVRTHSIPAVWSRTISGIAEAAVSHPPISEALRQLGLLGAGWEWSVGNLTVQCAASKRSNPDMAETLDVLFELIEAPPEEVGEEPVSEHMHVPNAPRNQQGAPVKNEAAESVVELVRRGGADCSGDRELLQEAMSHSDIEWRGGIRVNDTGSLVFVEAPVVRGIAKESGTRIAQITGVAYLGFFDGAADGLPLTNVSRIKEWFGDTLSDNYPEATPAFLRFATTYWTLKVLVREAERATRTTVADQVLIRLDDLLAHLFFPYEGPLIAPPDRREADQRRFLAAFAPRIDADEFMAGNPIILRDRKRFS